MLPALLLTGGAIYLGKQLIDAVFAENDSASANRSAVLETRVARRLGSSVRPVQLADTRRGMSRVFARKF